MGKLFEIVPFVCGW